MPIGNNPAVLMLAVASSFLVALAVLWILVGRLGRFGLDRPNERSLHERPVPRTGGLAVLAGTALALGFGAAPLWVPIALAAALAAISFADDMRSLPMAIRLAAHLAAAGLLVWQLGVRAPLELLAFAVVLAWVTNLYNFMDGADGLAGGMSVIGFAAYAVAAALQDERAMLVLCAALSAASAAFLIRNFHPARIFLGDVGSIPVGFLAGGLGVIGWREALWPLWFPLLVFAPFIGDATLTLFKRVARGERVWQAHRQHYYQRLVQLGAGHHGTAAVSYALMLVCSLAALYARNEAASVQVGVVAVVVALMAGVGAWIDLRWSRRSA